MTDSMPLKLSERGHKPALDGLRGIAVLMVMVFHFTHGWVYKGAIGSVIAHVMHAGWIGVDLFFVLSGFLITGILCDTRGARNYFPSFYGRRTLRIFPLYFAVLIFLWACSALANAPSDRMQTFQSWQHWLWWYGTNFAVAGEGRWLFESDWFSANHFWSLAVEEHFYLVWPFIIAFCAPRRAMKICIACIVMAITARCTVIATGGHAIANYVSTVCRIDALSIGALVALACRDPYWSARILPVAKRTGIIVAPCLLIWLTVFGLDKYNPWMQMVGYSITSLFFACSLIFLVEERLPNAISNLINNRTTRFFGKYSYGMYIFHALFAHWLVLQQPSISAAVGSPGLGRIAYLAIAFGGTIAVAMISWRVLESPFLALKRHFACDVLATQDNVEMPTASEIKPLPTIVDSRPTESKSLVSSTH